MSRVKRLLVVILIVAFGLLCVSGCEKKEPTIDRKAITKEIGVDVTAGKERYANIFEADSGNVLSTIVYEDNALEELVKDAEHWKALPMDSEFAELLQNIIPNAEEGYYYFQNMDKKADDKYDTAVITERSRKYIVSVYDVKKMVLYYVEVK
ncbi:MAG: hypothetical protein K6E39_04155 [Lachnospiraceae bacterium]|nr:hypothetical protein [Lachnospiraceae bacterium]